MLVYFLATKLCYFGFQFLVICSILQARNNTIPLEFLSTLVINLRHIFHLPVRFAPNEIIDSAFRAARHELSQVQ